MPSRRQKPKPWNPRQEVDTFKVFLIVEFWVVVIGAAVAMFALWWGLGIIGLALVAFIVAVAVGGF